MPKKHPRNRIIRRIPPERCGTPDHVNVLIPKGTSYEFSQACRRFLKSRGIQPKPFDPFH